MPKRTYFLFGAFFVSAESNFFCCGCAVCIHSSKLRALRPFSGSSAFALMDFIFCCSWKLCHLLQLVWTLFLSSTLSRACSRHAAQSHFATCGANGNSCGYSNVFRWSAFISLHMTVAGSPPVVSTLAEISLAELHLALLCFA